MDDDAKQSAQSEPEAGDEAGEQGPVGLERGRRGRQADLDALVVEPERRLLPQAVRGGVRHRPFEHRLIVHLDGHGVVREQPEAAFHPRQQHGIKKLRHQNLRRRRVSGRYRHRDEKAAPTQGQRQEGRGNRAAGALQLLEQLAVGGVAAVIVFEKVFVPLLGKGPARAPRRVDQGQRTQGGVVVPIGFTVAVPQGLARLVDLCPVCRHALKSHGLVVQLHFERGGRIIDGEPGGGAHEFQLPVLQGSREQQGQQHGGCHHRHRQPGRHSRAAIRVIAPGPAEQKRPQQQECPRDVRRGQDRLAPDQGGGQAGQRAEQRPQPGGDDHRGREGDDRLPPA